jgi:hypothetical protein
MVQVQQRVAFCAGVLAFALVARADDTVANPAYDSWARVGVGTVVKFTQSTDAMGTKASMQISEMLTEITPDAVKVEMKMSMVVAGHSTDLPAKTLTITAKTKKADDVGDATTKPAATTEDVVVDGKTYSCKVSTVSMEKSGMTIHAKTWSCPDVPGTMVKSEATTTGAVASTSTTILTGIEVK